MKKYAQLFIIVLSLMVGLGALFLVNQKKLLTVHQLDWCLHESFDPHDYINDAFNQNEVHIEGQVDQDQIGEYSLTYKYHHKKVWPAAPVHPDAPPHTPAQCRHRFQDHSP